MIVVNDHRRPTENQEEIYDSIREQRPEDRRISLNAPAVQGGPIRGYHCLSERAPKSEYGESK